VFPNMLYINSFLGLLLVKIVNLMSCFPSGLRLLSV